MNFSLCSRLKKEAELGNPSKSIINQGFCTQMFSTLGKIRAVMPQIHKIGKSWISCSQCNYIFLTFNYWIMTGLNVTSKKLFVKNTVRIATSGLWWFCGAFFFITILLPSPSAPSFTLVQMDTKWKIMISFFVTLSVTFTPIVIFSWFIMKHQVGRY